MSCVQLLASSLFWPVQHTLRSFCVMPPKKKTHEVTLALEAGNAAMVDLGKMPHMLIVPW